jgi:UDP-glucose 4-epimerase
VEAARRVTGREVRVLMGPRREGDPPRLVADPRRAGEVLGWRPQRASLDDIVRSAWEWHQAHPQGYRA